MRRIAGQQLMRAPGELVPLPRFGPDRQQPYLRVGHAQRGLRVSHAELAELDEHLRLGVGGRARVDEYRPARAGRQHDGEPGPQHAGQRPQPQPRGGHDAAGGPGRHHGGGVAAPDQLARHRHARPRAAQAGQRAFVHPQVVLGRHDLDLVDGAQPAEHLAEPGRRSGQQDPDAVLALGRERPGDDLTGGVIPAHGVDRDHRAGRAGPRARRAVRVAPAIAGASRVGLAVPRRGSPLRAVRHRTQRSTRVRGRGWCLILAVPLNLRCRYGGPIIALTRSSGGLGAVIPGARCGRRPVRPGSRRPHCTAKGAQNGALCQNRALGSCCDLAEYFLRIMVIVSTAERRKENRNH